MKKQLVVLAVFAVLGGLVLLGSTRGQSRTTGADPFAVEAPMDPSAQGRSKVGDLFGTEEIAPSSQSAYPSAKSFARSEIGRLMNQLREADDVERAELTKQLGVAVANHFDEDMKARETDL